MISVLIADDHEIVREGLKRIIDETIDIRVVSEASDGNQVMDNLRQHEVDVLILDISMPGQSGLEVLKLVKCHYPDIKVLVLSIFSENQYAIRMLRAGASGYLTKETAAEKLVHAIRRVASGRKYISPELAEQLVSDLDSPGDKPLHASLSDREFQVLRLLGSGMRVTDIARKLSLSVKTISTNRTRILRKLNLKNTAELICYALRHELVN